MLAEYLNKITLGNSVELLPFLPNGCVDLTVTSPPYDELRDYNGYCFDFPEMVGNLFRVTSDGGVVVWNVADATVDGSETGTSFRQALGFMDAGFKLHDTMIWQKPNFSNPSRTRYHQVFEYMFVFSKGKPKTFNPIKDRPNKNAGNIGSYGTNTVTQKDGTKKIRDRKVVSEFGMRHNVWQMTTTGQDGSSKKYQHPAMFPLQFATDHIRSWSNEGDVVLDPFSGSGTTCVAAKNTGRKYIGFEISDEYWKTSISRLDE